MRRKRKKRILDNLIRCKARMPNGRRCEAAAMRYQPYCVFHDPEMQRRRMELMFPIPYEHPDEIQRLLAEGVDAVKEKKLGSKEAYALGYLTTLLMQNQPRVAEARDQLDRAPHRAELQAAVTRWMVERGELKEKERARAEEEGE
jgi:hypothetical protein